MRVIRDPSLQGFSLCRFKASCRKRVSRAAEEELIENEICVSYKKSGKKLENYIQPYPVVRSALPSK